MQRRLRRARGEVVVAQLDDDGTPRHLVAPRSPAHHRAQQVDGILDLRARGQVVGECPLVAHRLQLVCRHDLPLVDARCPSAEGLRVYPEDGFEQGGVGLREVA